MDEPESCFAKAADRSEGGLPAKELGLMGAQ